MQTSDSRKRAAEGDPTLRAAHALLDAVMAPESTEAPEMAQRCDSVAPSGIPAPTVPRIARSVDDLRVGQWITTRSNTGSWTSHEMTAVLAALPDWDFDGGRVVILSEPPAPTLPTTSGSVIKADWDSPDNTHGFCDCTLFRVPTGWRDMNGQLFDGMRLHNVRVLFDAGVDA